MELQGEIDELLVAEKKARQAGEAEECTRLVCSVLRKYQRAGDWERVNEFVVLLCKKRGQLKKCIVEAVQLCMRWIQGPAGKPGSEAAKTEESKKLESKGDGDEAAMVTEDDSDAAAVEARLREEKEREEDIAVEMRQEQKLKLIKALISVTEGKIFVEVERARLTRISSKLKEDEGNVEEAATLLQEVQIETFSTMESREKAEYILEQMRLVLLKRDFVRCQIISRKLNPKLLEEFPDLKLRYYNYMVRYYLHEQALLDVCKAYHQMLKTDSVEKDPEQWKQMLTSYVVFLLLSPFDNEQKDLLLKLQTTEKKRLEELPTYKKLLNSFLTVELLPWPLSYETSLKEHEAFLDTPFPGGEERWKLMRKRVMQHNVQVLGAYYRRISTKRMSELLGMPKDECEGEISDLVCSKFLMAKMDRPSGLVTFGERKDTCDYLNEWSADISRLLNLMEESSHLIQKERMVNAARAKQAQIQAKTMPATRSAT